MEHRRRQIARPFGWLPCALILIVGTAIPAPAGAQDIREEVKKPKEPQLTKPPKLLKFVPAVYPTAAQKKGIQGTVQLSIELDAAGKVSKAEVVKSPDPSLSEAAVAAVKQFTFSPAEVDGKPAPIRVQYAYNFVLELAFSPKLPAWMEDRQNLPPSEDVVTGRVREQGTRLPVAGSAVAISDLGLEVKADGKGYFGFKDVPPGKYKVIAISGEHKREEVEVEVKKGEQSQITFYLPRLTVNPYETVVRGKRRKTVVTRVTLRQKELTTVPGTFGDPVRVVENLPGVTRIPYVGGALLIRGAPPGDSGVFLDGIKVPLIYHFLGGPSVLNPQFLDRIDYYPGNPDVRYGRLIAGVVDVHTRKTFSQQWSGSLDVNLLNTSVFLQAPITERITVAGALRRSYIDAILPAVLKSVDRPATTVVPVYYDYQARVDVKLPNDNQLFVLAFGSDDQLAIASNEDEEDISVDLDTQITFHRVLAGWRWQISDKLVSRLRPAFGIDYVTMDVGDSSVELRTIVFNLREELELKLSKRVTLRAGLDLEVGQESFDAEIPLPANYRNPGAGIDARFAFTQETATITIDQTRLGIGAYVDAIVDLTDRLQVIPGVRLELFRFFGNTRPAIDPRLTVRYGLLKKTTLKAAAGMYSKAPPPFEANETAGNPDLQLEHAVHFSGGVEQEILPALTLDAQLYFNRRYGISIGTDEVIPTDSGLKPLRFINSGVGNSYGLELILKHNVTERFYGWLAYTLSRSEQVSRVGREIARTGLDQTHILTLVASVKLGRGWETGARFRLATGRPETPIHGGLFDSDLNRYMRITGERNSVSRQLFHQLDFRVEKTWFFDLWRLSAYLDVQNVYNAENPEATLWDYRFRESGPLRGLPILPTIGIKGAF